MVNPNLKNLGLLPIASAAAACADLNARLPLPINRDQTRLYRAICDERGANGTVALRLKSGFMDIESGEAPLYNNIKDPKQFIGMTSTSEWLYQANDENVFTVNEKMSCQAVHQPGDKKVQKTVQILVHFS